MFHSTAQMRHVDVLRLSLEHCHSFLALCFAARPASVESLVQYMPEQGPLCRAELPESTSLYHTDLGVGHT